MDKVRGEGQAIVGMESVYLLQKPLAEHDYRLLSRVDLQKIFAHVTGDWYPARMSRGWLLDELLLIAGQYRELSPPDASESERLPVSPMSAHGGGEEKDVLNLASWNAPVENADVSMADRSVDDIPK